MQNSPQFSRRRFWSNVVVFGIIKLWVQCLPTVSSYLPKLRGPPGVGGRPPQKTRSRFSAKLSTVSVLSDPYVLQLAETLEDSIASTSFTSVPPPLQRLRDVSSESLLSTSWPTRKDESFRFTDTSFIKNSDIQPITPASAESISSLSVDGGGEISLVEEYNAVQGNDGCYWTNAVMEMVIGNEAKVSHSYIQTESRGAAHIKWASVRQERRSEYKLGEVSIGGKLSRHNVHVQQVGPGTITELSTLQLIVGVQLQDLHSILVLNHPRGFTRQLHKCIVAHSRGEAVFDGIVQVNREVQQTDAGQLTRCLLLEPRATVNVKPNRQNLADDVKCSHGAAISDLEADQIHYFQARGIDGETARRALIFSFAADLMERLPQTSVQKKVGSLIKNVLNPVLT